MEEVKMTEEELRKNIAENNPNMTENVKKGIDLGEWANTTKNNIILSHENLKSFSVNAIDLLVRKVAEQQTQIAYLTQQIATLKGKGKKKSKD
jgi:hypothetical protein